MQLYILGQNRALAGIVESFEYLRWTRRYHACGVFELKAIANANNTALLRVGNYLWKNDDSECGIIEHLEMTSRDKEMIFVKGRFATSILARRIIWGTEVLTGDAGGNVSGILNRHLRTPTDTSRKIDYIDYLDRTPYMAIQMQASYRNLMDVIFNICETNDAGLQTVYNPATKRFTVDFYKAGAAPAVFSQEYENLNEQNYLESNANFANTALVGGEGEGAARTLVPIISGSGENRREIFVDAKDLREEEFPTNYTAALLYRGQSKLAELSPARSFDAAVNPHGNLRYKTDYDLGQTVTVISKKWGVTLNARITEVEESYDVTGQSINIVFGKGVLTLFQKLKGAL